MRRESHVRFCEGGGVRFPSATRLLACFQYREDAERFLAEMGARLGKFHLELEPTKTKLLKFGRFAEEDARRDGKKPETFTFLGFTHYCGQTRNGYFKVKRRTSKKKFRAKLKEMRAWLKETRCHQKAGVILRLAKARLQGHLNYYAITDNYWMCASYRYQVTRLLYKWLNRRSQRRSYNWERFSDALAWVGWPSVRIVHNLEPFRRPVGLENC